ncbi:twin-arginine translocase TatA/TatE family subunit [Rhodohalobacter sp. SW132]|uniref:Sec-independent protein translocase subunit TatA/TatB n=1 Tax=Rhodohalobacter sp. SW132 TaxID=2293433 RepID=UPI000E27EB36|nr:twin-arginine translocase TatA/TatE family subunit [Rhodohalobacter sp. SW132]REL24300.1 twin-arginine translocase TatA/TatE family subunit [Rhodohalobacter sp. SW132]
MQIIMGMPGGFEIVIIVMIILLLFGAKRIPELARGIGQGIQEFRKASDDIKKEIDKGADDIKNSASARPSKETESESNSDK